MPIENRIVKWAVVSLLALLLIPVVVMLGMMIFGASMMAQMTGMMGGGLASLCALWTVLVAAALVFLIVLLTRGPGASDRSRISSSEVRSPLPH
jgi:uncharacterized membrane protein